MLVKCRYCEIKDTDRKDMEVEESVSKSGNKQRKYYHKNCYPKHLADKEFKEKEQNEMDELVETIMKVHKISNMPNQFYPFIQDLRNGTVLFGKKKKKYKEGYPYSLISKTYIFCSESIEYWKKNKNFESTMQELKYCWAIINDKINVVKKQEAKKQFHKAKKKAEEEQQQSEQSEQRVPSHVSNVKFKKKQREDDISDFL